MYYYVDNKNNQDPALNLALEEYLIRNPRMTDDYFLLYINNPSVIIGRHQNAFEEADLLFLQNQHIPLIRRISGGGTVYHDRGNLNFSFITRYQKFKFNNYSYFNQPILNALHSLGIRAEFGRRNEMVIGQEKISGNAQFTSKNRMISHGTLLFRSRLDRLSRVLLPASGLFRSGARKSVPSPVVNIGDYLPRSVTINKLKQIILQHVFGLANDIPLCRLKGSQWQEIRQLANNKYRQWEWNFGESPDFTYDHTIISPSGDISAKLVIHKGHIVNFDVHGKEFTKHQNAVIKSEVIGCKYDTVPVKEKLDIIKKAVPGLKVSRQTWLSLFFSPQ
jgi:lipoate-protein ligase A